jgi:hypothetical protein
LAEIAGAQPATRESLERGGIGGVDEGAGQREAVDPRPQASPRSGGFALGLGQGQGCLHGLSDASLRLTQFAAAAGVVVGSLSATFDSRVTSGTVRLP